RLLVEDHDLSWQAGRELVARAAACRVEVEGAQRPVEALRSVKDEAEIERIAAACRLTQEGLEWLFTEVVAPGLTERELAIRLERRFIDTGADGIAFPSIVASGPNAAIPHHEPTDRQLRPGDLLTIDCGAMIDGYHADHTRTVAIGHLDERLTRVHGTVAAAQAAGIAAIRPGAVSGEVDAAARAVIEEAGFGAAFVHGTGHGVGLAIHEAPAVARGATATLRPGIVFTVEPGIYLSGLGGVRIEDTLVVTADGNARALTDTPRELRIL
ncbi:MAG: M24 family metallopeptidase, partial [Nitriliruptoraceae bacterium]